MGYVICATPRSGSTLLRARSGLARGAIGALPMEMADATSADWAARFCVDLGKRGS
jgi:LPS sulfotransferase NodH